MLGDSMGRGTGNGACSVQSVGRGVEGLPKGGEEGRGVGGGI